VDTKVDKATLEQYAVDSPDYLRPERYTNPAFCAQEHELMWSKVWQMACRVEDLPKLGNYLEYEIGDQSVLIVRHGEEERDIKAFMNVCRHRGRQLANGSGTFRGRRMVCRFHGWAWNLDGSNNAVFGAELGFDPSVVRKEELGLIECSVGVWAGMVFVNLDPNAEPLEQYLAPIAPVVKPVGVDRMRTLWWQQINVDANWKLCLEAFMEGYHVCYTHPQMIFAGKPDPAMPNSILLRTLERGHTYFNPNPEARNWRQEWSQDSVKIDPFERLVGTLRTLSPVLQREIDIIESLRGKPVPEGSSIEAEAVKAVIVDAMKRGVEMPAPEVAVTWGSVYHVFPNIVIYPFFGNCWIMRARPNGPDRSLVDIWLVTLPAKGQEFPKPKCDGPFRSDDADHISLITVQDFGNLEPVQRGMRAKGLGMLRLSSRWEGLISHRHIEIDRYLGLR